MLSRCPSCAAEVSEEADRCPNCHWDFIQNKHVPPSGESPGGPEKPPVPEPGSYKENASARAPELGEHSLPMAPQGWDMSQGDGLTGEPVSFPESTLPPALDIGGLAPPAPDAAKVPEVKGRSSATGSLKPPDIKISHFSETPGLGLEDSSGDDSRSKMSELGEKGLIKEPPKEKREEPPPKPPKKKSAFGWFKDVISGGAPASEAAAPNPPRKGALPESIPETHAGRLSAKKEGDDLDPEAELRKQREKLEALKEKEAREEKEYLRRKKEREEREAEEQAQFLERQRALKRKAFPDEKTVEPPKAELPKEEVKEPVREFVYEEKSSKKSARDQIREALEKAARQPSPASPPADKTDLSSLGSPGTTSKEFEDLLAAPKAVGSGDGGSKPKPAQRSGGGKTIIGIVAIMILLGVVAKFMTLAPEESPTPTQTPPVAEEKAPEDMKPAPDLTMPGKEPAKTVKPEEPPAPKKADPGSPPEEDPEKVLARMLREDQEEQERLRGGKAEALGETWKFEGQVYDLINLIGIVDAKLRFSDAEGKVRGETKTTEGGLYVISLIGVKGGYTLAVNHPDYRDKWIDDINPPLRTAELADRRLLIGIATRPKNWIGLTGKTTKRDFLMIPKIHD